MKTVPSLDDLVAMTLARASQHVANGEDLLPVLIAVGEEPETDIVLGFPDYGNPRVKKAARDKMREFLAEYRCTKYVFVMEAWLGAPKMADAHYRPRNDPERREAIVATAVEKGGARYCVFVEYKRNADKTVSFSEPKRPDAILDGSLADLFGPSGFERETVQ
jgi:hypothetical protein